jgi:tripartite-type tricarboxylate transporter receptor subunit TctC
VSTHVVNPVVQKDLRYDPLASFTLISQIAAVPNAVSVHPAVPAKTLAELIEYARRNPGKLNYGTPGIGSLAHLLGETFKYSAKVDLTHVPYRGAGPALNDAIAGQVQVFFDNLPSSLPHIQSGKLRALAVSSEKRVPALPDVPTFAEAGLPGATAATWWGLGVPAGTPAQATKQVGDALAAVVDSPEMRTRFEREGAEPLHLGPREFSAHIAAETAKWTRVVRDAGIKAQ